MPLMTYLWRHPNSGVYYFRRAVPDPLRTALGKTMVKKSLGTKNVAEAKRRAHPLAVQTEAEFEAARKHRAAPIRTELTDREVALLVDAYHHQLLAADDAARIDGSGEGIKLDTGSASYRRLCFEFLRTAVRAIEAMVQRHGGELVDTPSALSPTLSPGWRRSSAAFSLMMRVAAQPRQYLSQLLVGLHGSQGR
jgi:hypothetical protein